MKQSLLEWCIENERMELIEQWSREKNESISPRNVTSGSNKKVWWKCEKGHQWEAVISSRTRGIGCPYCSGRLAIPNETDLATVHPEIAKEWNYKKWFF